MFRPALLLIFTLFVALVQACTGKSVVANRPPVVQVSTSGPYEVTEGTTLTFTVDFTDPDGDGLSVAITDCSGFVTCVADGNHITISAAPDYGDGNTAVSVSVAATDSRGATSPVTFVISATRSTTQRVYYVSSDGDDSNTGTSPDAAWRTIAKVNASTFAAGDLILFRRGDTFRGQINVGTAGLTFRAFGPGTQKPVISGAERLTNWTLYSGSIYVTKASSLVRNLFANEAQMTLARYPNMGFLTVASTNGTNTITAVSGIDQASGYWNGANLIIRVVPYYYQEVQVVSFDGTSLVLGNSGMRYSIKDTGLHFYLNNKLAILDAPGEWYCDPATNDVYFYAPDGVDPNMLNVEASIYDYGVNGTQSNTTVKDLDFRYQIQAALRFSGALDNIQILSNHISDSLVSGIQTGGVTTNLIIDGNVIERANSHGMYLGDIRASTISNNEVKDIGLVAGFGVDHARLDSIYGIAAFGSGYTIRRNRIDHVGYTGIRPDGVSALVEENVVKNSMLTLADGGGIYAYGEGGRTHDGVWRNNIIDTVLGDSDGGRLTGWTSSVGLYLDYGCDNMTLEGNTVMRASAAGLFIQYNDTHEYIRNNLIYDCGTEAGGKSVQLIQDTTMHYGGHEFTGNILYPTNKSQRLFYVQQNNDAALAGPGIMDNNYYCNPYNNVSNLLSTLTRPGGVWTGHYYTLDSWRTLFGQDAHSKDLYTHFADGERPERLFVNETTDSEVVDLAGVTYRDLDGNVITGSIVLAPFSSRILIRQ